MPNEPNKNMVDQQMNLLDGFSHPQPDEDTIRRVRSAVRSELNAQRRTSWIFRIGAPLAAAACLAIGITMWSQWSGNTGSTSGTTVSNGAARQAGIVDLLIVDWESQTDVATTQDSSLTGSDDELEDSLNAFVWDLVI